MKKTIYGLYVLFFVLMVVTFYIAHKVYDGLVEDRYYERSKAYFETKKTEENLGLIVNVDRDMKPGKNLFKVSIEKKDGKLLGAKSILFVGDIASEKYDRSYILVEYPPGTYSAEIDIPFTGTWLFRLDIEHSEIVTGRRWTARIE